MGLRVRHAANFEFCDGMKQVVMGISFMAMLFPPASATRNEAGMPNFFGRYTDQIAELIADITWELDEMVDENSLYGAGSFPPIIFDLHDGLSIVVILTIWSPDTCNLGKGSESKNPTTLVSGFQIREVISDHLLVSLRELIVQNFGYGLIIETSFSLSYFPAPSDSMKHPSDNNPENHRHELLEQDSVENFSNLENAPPASWKSDFNGTWIYSQPTSSASRVPMSDNQIRAAARMAHGEAQMNSSTTNSTASTGAEEKFPTDPSCDCDIPNLVLMWALGPTDAYHLPHVAHIQMLNPTDMIWSPNGRFQLVMQIDCNLVLYDIVAQTSLWSSNTQDKGRVCFASLTISGELVVYDSDINDVLFRTNTWCTGNGGDCWTGTVLEIQDDGNLVLYISETGYPLWASNTVVCPRGC